MITWFSTKSLKGAVALGLVFFLGGCLSPDFTYIPSKKAKTATLSKSTVDGPSIAAFESTVYPILRSRCSGCHGANQSPFFASSDPSYAHSEVVMTGKVNFQDIDSSRLIRRLSVDMHNCWKDCGMAASEMKAAITQWSSARGSSGTSPSGQITPTGSSPATLGTTAVVLSFPISGFFSPSLAGAVFEISVVKFDNYSYRFFAPKIKSTTATAIYVKSVNLVLNGAIPTGSTTYDSIDQVFTTSSAGVTLSNSSMILEMANGPGNDKVSIQFETLTYGSGSALAGQRFTTALNTIRTNCAGCHTTTNAPLFGSFTTEAQFLALNHKNAPLVVKKSADTSTLYKVIMGTQTPTMPPNASTANRTTIATPIKTWIDQIP